MAAVDEISGAERPEIVQAVKFDLCVGNIRVVLGNYVEIRGGALKVGLLST